MKIKIKQIKQKYFILKWYTCCGGGGVEGIEVVIRKDNYI